MEILSAQQLVEKDLKYIWHPCSQMKDYESFPSLVIKSAKGSYLELTDGRRIIDAISSWWGKSLGHNHPVLKKALQEQLEYFEHVIFTHTTYETIVKLSEKLANLSPQLNKIFYAGDGSCAVEVALKMSLHAQQLQGNVKRKTFLSLKNAYHGETAGALSVSDIDLYSAPYQPLLFKTYKLNNIPYVNNRQDPLWDNCENHWGKILLQLEPLADNLSGIIVEPIVQGAAGMKIYSADFLKRLRLWTKARGIHLIADEIMTGLGRTGTLLACQHANIEPDLLCLGKGLTSGWFPFSAVLTTNQLYQLFYDDYEKNTSFLHSHTYCGNALGASVALATLETLEKENICQRTQQLESKLAYLMNEVALTTNKLANIRYIGGIVAGDLKNVTPNTRPGFAIYKKAVELGAFLRPLGNTIYWLPPLNIEESTLEELAEITKQALM